MRPVDELSVDIVELLPDDVVELLLLGMVEPELELLGIVELLLPLGIVELLPMPELELDEPVEVVVPDDDGVPVDGCERSPCDKPPAGAVVGLVTVADGVVAVPVAVVAGADIVDVPVLDWPCSDCVGEPSLRALSLAGAGVVADGVLGVVCADAKPIEATSAAAAAAVLNSLNEVMEILLKGDEY